MSFELVTPLVPAGDQPRAIDELTAGLVRGDKYQTLLGVTGSGKTFTMANVIARVNRPTLVISHNKTLAAQLYAELKGFFPNNAVEFFISYYDYYQPEGEEPRRVCTIRQGQGGNDAEERRQNERALQCRAQSHDGMRLGHTLKITRREPEGKPRSPACVRRKSGSCNWACEGPAVVVSWHPAAGDAAL